MSLLVRYSAYLSGDFYLYVCVLMCIEIIMAFIVSVRYVF